MVRRTKEEALETRCQLLDAAEQVFSAKGVTNTSLNEIAEAAGVTRGAVYWHFRNKMDLIDALMERVRLPLEDLREQAMAMAPNDVVAQIRLNAIDVLRRTVRDPHHQAIANILLHKCEYVDDVLPIKQRHLESRNECATEVEQRFQEAVSAGQLPSCTNPRLATMALFSYVDGLVYNWLLEPSYFDLDRDAEHLIDVFFDGLRRREPVPSTAQAANG